MRLNEDTLVLTWNKISGAKGYQVQITGQEDRVIRTNMLSLESLDPGSYEIRIKSLGDQDETQDSEWVSYQFTREEETGLSYRLINNNTEYQLHPSRRNRRSFSDTNAKCSQTHSESLPRT